MKRKRRNRTRAQILAGREIGKIEFISTPSGNVGMNFMKKFCNREGYKNREYNGYYMKELEKINNRNQNHGNGRRNGNGAGARLNREVK